MKDRRIVKAEVREAAGDDGPEWHVECWFSNGEKYAPVVVDGDHEDLANQIARLLNTEATRADQGVERIFAALDEQEVSGLREDHLGPQEQMILTGDSVEVSSVIVTKAPDADSAHGVDLPTYTTEDNARRAAGQDRPVVEGHDGSWRALKIPGSDWDEMTMADRVEYCRSYSFELEISLKREQSDG